MKEEATKVVFVETPDKIYHMEIDAWRRDEILKAHVAGKVIEVLFVENGEEMAPIPSNLVHLPQ